VGAELSGVERERRGKTGKAAAGSVMNAADPVEAFDGASLAVRRAVVEAVMNVILIKRRNHGGGHFDPETVRIEWKHAAENLSN
jgi:hypothetical protein